MLVWPLLCWAGWWLGLAQVTLGAVRQREPCGASAPWLSPCSWVLQHLCHLS